jgi:hypothetical protein
MGIWSFVETMQQGSSPFSNAHLIRHKHAKQPKHSLGIRDATADFPPSKRHKALNVIAGFLHTTTHRHAYHHAVGSVASRKDMDDDPSFSSFASVLSSSSTSLLQQHTGQTVSASDQ